MLARSFPYQNEISHNYRESKKLQQADLAKLEKVVRKQMDVVAKLKMEQKAMVVNMDNVAREQQKEVGTKQEKEQKRLTKILHAKD